MLFTKNLDGSTTSCFQKEEKWFLNAIPIDYKRIFVWLGLEAYTSNPRIWEAGSARSARLQSKFQAGRTLRDPGKKKSLTY